ncbi:MAG: hypothetical protein HRT47_09770 [Candidatus Caenarcaniphilales bacterium]|nr:hypothetical protein [Candidatus Caenarcaniphilales bacterium]
MLDKKKGIKILAMFILKHHFEKFFNSLDAASLHSLDNAANEKKQEMLSKAYLSHYGVKPEANELLFLDLIHRKKTLV